MFKELIVLNYFIFNRKNNIKKNYWKKLVINLIIKIIMNIKISYVKYLVWYK